MPTWKPGRLDAVLIVKNEEAVLGRCLESLQGVDRICVLDTGSSDRTMEIAARSGAFLGQARIEPFDFAAARNRAEEMATGDWILTLDADEVLLPGGLEAIREAIELVGSMKGSARVTAFRARFRLYGDDGEAPAEIQKVKVHRRGAYEWRYRIHEQLTALEPGGIVNLSDLVIEHRPLPGRAHRREQNTELLKLAVAESPEYLRNVRQLGMEYFLAGEWASALEWLPRFLKTCTDPVDASEIRTKIAQAKDKLGRDPFEDFDLAAALCPIRREPLWHKAVALISRARLDEAIGVLEKCLAIPEALKPDYFLNLAAVWDGSLPSEALAFCRAQIEEAKAKAAARAT